MKRKSQVDSVHVVTDATEFRVKRLRTGWTKTLLTCERGWFWLCLLSGSTVTKEVSRSDGVEDMLD